MKTLLSRIISAGLGLWLATLFIPNVVVQILPNSNVFGIHLSARWELFILLGIVIGLLNFFIKPILNLITLPLQIITLGIMGFFIAMGMIWITDSIFAELSVPFFWPLLWTTVIITAIDILLGNAILKEKK